MTSFGSTTQALIAKHVNSVNFKSCRKAVLASTVAEPESQGVRDFWVESDFFARDVQLDHFLHHTY